MFSRRTDWNLTPNRLTLAQREIMRQGKQILDLTVSNPTRVGLEYDQAQILSALPDARVLDYDPQPKGLLEARHAVANYYGRDTSSVNPESITLTTSTSEGYSFLFRLLANAGDEILVPKPSYPLFDFLADLQDVRLIGYPLLYDHGWHIDFPSLDRLISERTRAIVVVHPNNPTGSYVKAAERDQLNRLCLRHNIALIADEVFLDYANPSAQPRASRSFSSNQEALTFTLSGLSKISALPQMKLAWIVASGPPKLSSDAMERLEVIADTYLSVNAPIQFAAKILLDQRHSIQQQLASRILDNLSELDRQLDLQKGCTRLQTEGGWNVILRVPATRADEDLAITLLQACSVLTHPGHFYDFGRDGYLVLSLITPRAQFRDGMSRLLQFLSDTSPLS
jgi:alanine-synthesizing transaminase